MTEPASTPIPSVRKRFSLPPGVLPRNAQAWAIGAIALSMAAIIAFSGSTTPPGKDRKQAPAAEPATDANQSRIQEYRARIEEQARRLSEEQAKLVKVAPIAGAPGEFYSAGNRHKLTASDGPTYANAQRAIRTEYPVRGDARRREESLFASNIALSYRPSSETHASTGERVRGQQTPDPALLLALAQLTARTPQTSNPPEPPPKPQISADKKVVTAAAESGLLQAEGPQYRLFEGTVIETALVNRLDGDFSGPVNCMVTTNLYSHNRQHLLIPQGSRVLGEVRRVESFGQTRLAVTFHRLIMPDGYSVDLDQFKGLNQVGETGLRDKVNNHYLKMFGASLAIGVLAGFAQANTRGGFDASGTDVYRQGVASNLSQSSLRILDRYLNVLPTLTIREGHRVKVYLSADLLVPAYDNHRMPSGI